jgi:hypothetical protein
MKIAAFLAFVLWLASPTFAADSKDAVTAICPSLPVSEAVKLVELFSGNKVVADEKVLNSKAYASFKFKEISKGKAVRIIRRALLKSGVIIIQEGDHFRAVILPKPANSNGSTRPQTDVSASH